MLPNLKAEMTRFGVTYKDIANIIEKDVRAIKNRVNGNVNISAEELKTIRDAFFPFCTLDYLLEETPAIVETKRYSLTTNKPPLTCPTDEPISYKKR